MRRYPASFSHTRLLTFVQKKAKKECGESRETTNDAKRDKASHGGYGGGIKRWEFFGGHRGLFSEDGLPAK